MLLDRSRHDANSTLDAGHRKLKFTKGRSGIRQEARSIRQLRSAGFLNLLFPARELRTCSREEKLGQLYFNHHPGQLSRRTPPAIVSRERRATLDSSPSSHAPAPSTVNKKRKPIASSLLPTPVAKNPLSCPEPL